jgi:hypothetical protein
MQKINEVATRENARKYKGLQDQFIFCLELLGDISANHPKADEWVNALEDQFDIINRVESLEDDRRDYAEALEYARKRGGPIMVQDAEDNIEGTDCLIGNAWAELAELQAAQE